MKKDYHDYFIKDGRHIGDYEGMYKNCPDPWRIEEMGPRLDMKAALLLLDGLGPVHTVLDIGAGLGLFSELVAQKIWPNRPPEKFLVTDISSTAVDKAKARLAGPGFMFEVFDLTNPHPLADAPFDLVIMAQVLWGILENFKTNLKHLTALVKTGGHLLVSQHFPQPGAQGYGADVVSSPAELAEHLQQQGFAVVDTLETNRAANHHWAAILEKM